MLADVPPPPAYECMKAAEVKEGSVFFTISGDPRQAEAMIGEIRARHPAWKIDADATSNGVRFVRVRAPIATPYREIGGLVFDAQRQHLAVAVMTEPLICEVEESK